MTENPYSAPFAEVSERIDATEPVRVYSPTQVACGTIGGPVGLIYFLKANFEALGYHSAARKTLIFGGLALVALISIVPFLPEKFPGAPSTIAYIVIGRFVASKYQMTKAAIAESPLHYFQSNWRVFGFTILCLIGSTLVIFVPLFALAYFGVIAS